MLSRNFSSAFKPDWNAGSGSRPAADVKAGRFLKKTLLKLPQALSLGGRARQIRQ